MDLLILEMRGVLMVIIMIAIISFLYLREPTKVSHVNRIVTIPLP